MRKLTSEEMKDQEWMQEALNNPEGTVELTIEDELTDEELAELEEQQELEPAGIGELIIDDDFINEVMKEFMGEDDFEDDLEEDEDDFDEYDFNEDEEDYSEYEVTEDTCFSKVFSYTEYEDIKHNCAEGIVNNIDVIELHIRELGVTFKEQGFNSYERWVSCLARFLHLHYPNMFTTTETFMMGTYSVVITKLKQTISEEAYEKYMALERVSLFRTRQFMLEQDIENKWELVIGNSQNRVNTCYDEVYYNKETYDLLKDLLDMGAWDADQYHLGIYLELFSQYYDRHLIEINKHESTNYNKEYLPAEYRYIEADQFKASYRFEGLR